MWNEEACDSLRGCFECTNWEVLTDSSSSLEEAVDVGTSYMLFCEDSVIPTKTVKVYPNNKPWVTKKLKGVLNEKKRAFMISDKAEGKRIQSELNNQIKNAKTEYKDKIERQFQYGNLRSAWQGLKTLAGTTPRPTNPRKTVPEDQAYAFANELNTFYSRFDQRDFSAERRELESELRDRLPHSPVSLITSDDVSKTFSKVDPYKAPGPDNISGQLLKVCHGQLGQVFSVP